MKEADPKYHDYEDTQVIDSNPKQGTKVKIGTTVCLRYITAEVIEASQKYLMMVFVLNRRSKNRRPLKSRKRRNI